jgi:secretion/DNA translocation related CpaE-like protein
MSRVPPVPPYPDPSSSADPPVCRVRPLLVTTDPGLLDDVLRLAAAAGVEVDVSDASAARPRWLSAPLVIVGADEAEDLLRPAPSRRPGVVLVGLDLDDAGVWERAVDLGAEQVVFLPDAEPWLVERLADGAQRSTAQSRAICVIGGRGGAGASTLAAALAVTGMRRDLRGLLVDGDPLGGGIDLVLGGEDVPGLRWPGLSGARGRIDGDALRDHLPLVDRLTVLAWDRGDRLTIPADAMAAVLAGGRQSSDLVVVDLPRRLDEAAEVALAGSDLTLLIVPAEVRAAASAARIAAQIGRLAADLRVVVRGPAPSHLTGEEVSRSLGLSLAGELSAEPGIAEALERGEPPARRGRGPLASFCAGILDELVGAARAVA